MTGGRLFSSPWEHFIIDEATGTGIEDPAVRELLLQNKPGQGTADQTTTKCRFPFEDIWCGADILEVLLSQGFVALVTDGWSNSRRESFINFIVTGEDTKTGPYMVTMIGEVFDEVEAFLGKGKIVAVTSDNASAMKSAWAILQDRHPGLMTTGCTPHTVSLMMKDVLAVPELMRC
ncbi:unnamed protein product [Phytophthora fragariaefolia]|uniref:Unnamed protein product n=1 Tax=Phytophthora fragariaefolia TaxID=1490495 RepID=A0A9W6XSM5_9STRA|nr:unnamed protein product [Phytophthora fragariaefolia]